MRLLKEIKERRLIPLMGAYLVTGFVAVEAVSQAVQVGILPSVANPLIWVVYLFGIPGSLIFAWFHGAPGRQYGPRVETVLQSTLAVLALGTGVYVYRHQPVPLSLAEESGLPPNDIAVLYFEDVSAGESLGYVADGITEALIEQLSDVRSLDVISSNGVLLYRDADVREDSIARALGVGTLIAGSVDQRGDDLRITTRLVDGFSGADIDRASIDIPAGEFLAARDSVAENVSRLLRRRLGEEVRLRELRAGTSSEEAWALAQRAERLSTDAEDNFEAGGDLAVSVGAYTEADSLLALAEQVDPKWVRPIAARAQAAYRRAFFAATAGDAETDQVEIDTGLAHANRALAMDPRFASALEQRGTLKVLAALTVALDPDEQERLIAEAEADLEGAVREDPALASAYAMLGFALGVDGDMVGAVLNARRALEEDAYLRGADRIYDRLVYAQYDLGQFRDARSWCDEGYRRFPENYRFTECQLWLMAAPNGGADVEGAWDLLARLDSLTPESQRPYKHGVGQIMVAGALRKAGLADSASSVLGRVDHREEVDLQRNLFEYEAAILATTGDEEGALEALRRWVAMTPGSTLGEEGEEHWWWQSLRTEPEFQQFVERGN